MIKPSSEITIDKDDLSVLFIDFFNRGARRRLGNCSLVELVLQLLDGPEVVAVVLSCGRSRQVRILHQVFTMSTRSNFDRSEVQELPSNEEIRFLLM